MRFEQGGAGFTAPVDEPVLLASEDTFLLEDYFFYESPLLDMRAFQSYNLRLRLEDGTYTDRHIAEVAMVFYMKPSGTDETFTDNFVIYKTNLSHTSPFSLTDVCHGSWMRLQVLDYFSVGKTTYLSYELYGSYRPTSNTFIRNSTNELQIYSDTQSLAAGAVSTGVLGQFAYGPAYLIMKSGAGGGCTIDLKYGEDNNAFDQLIIPAASADTVATKQIVLPRKQMRAIITNTGAGANVIRAGVFQQLQPF